MVGKAHFMRMINCWSNIYHTKGYRGFYYNIPIPLGNFANEMCILHRSDIHDHRENFCFNFSEKDP